MQGTDTSSGTTTTGEGARRHVVLVTGASSGIGRATALRLLRHADTFVVLAARRAGELWATAELAGPDAAGRADVIECDLSSAAGARALAATVRARHPDLTALVNNAGAGAACDFDDAASGAEIERVLALDLQAPMLLTHALQDLLVARGGALVNVASVAGLVGTPASPAYSSAKWGLVGFSESMRARLGQVGVRVTCIQPGPVPTPGWPHERIAASPLRRVLGSDVDTVARAIERACRGVGRARASRTLPATYAVLPLLRGVAPGLLRRMLAAAWRRDPIGRRTIAAHRAAHRSGRARTEASS